MRQRGRILVPIMHVLRGKIYFPVPVFHRFRVIGEKRRTGHSEFGHKHENIPEYCIKKNYIQDTSQMIAS
jgi:hypothetical protein